MKRSFICGLSAGYVATLPKSFENTRRFIAAVQLIMDEIARQTQEWLTAR